MSKRPFPLAGVSSTALVLMLTGCAASLPNSQSSAPPTTAPDTVAALQAHQPEVVSPAQRSRRIGTDHLRPRSDVRR